MSKQTPNINVDESDEDEERTVIFCENLDERVTEDLLYELFLQAGPVESVRVIQSQNGMCCPRAFVTYVHKCTIPYALELYQGLSLYHKKLFIGCSDDKNLLKEIISSPSCKNENVSYDNSSFRDVNSSSTKNGTPKNPFRNKPSPEYPLSFGDKHDNISKRSSSERRFRQKDKRSEKKHSDHHQERDRDRDCKRDRDRSCDKNDEYVANRNIDESDEEDEANRILFCGNLDKRVTEDLLYELFLQAGPIESARIAQDKNGRRRSFGFVTYVHKCTISYAMELYQGLSLYGKMLVISRSGDKDSLVKEIISSPSCKNEHSTHDNLNKHSLGDLSNSSGKQRNVSKRSSLKRSYRTEYHSSETKRSDCRNTGRNSKSNGSGNYEYDRDRNLDRKRHYERGTRRKSDQRIADRNRK